MDNTHGKIKFQERNNLVIFNKKFTSQICINIVLDIERLIKPLFEACIELMLMYVM